jgi:hypothetical protein
MRYLAVLDLTHQPATPPAPELMKAITELGEQATRAGVLLDTGGLLPSSAGVRITLDEEGVTTMDGPFPDSKEMISYALYEVSTKEEAVEWASTFMELHRQHWPGWTGTTRLLKVFGPEDAVPDFAS